jgi:REP element-mobilizing transposase RayT
MHPEISADRSLPARQRPAHFPGLESGNRSTIFFVTVCTKDRRRVLGSHEAHVLLLEAWKNAKSYCVGRYVILPDHVHLFCGPATCPGESLTRWIAYWKSLVARRWPDPGIGKLWQRDFWDTQLRRGESYGEKWDYVRLNPVRAGLVTRAEDWPFQGEIKTLRWHD